MRSNVIMLTMLLLSAVTANNSTAANTTASPPPPEYFHGFYSYEVAPLDGNTPVLRCFVETQSAASLIEPPVNESEVGSGIPTPTFSCPADTRLVNCVNASEQYGGISIREAANAAKAAAGASTDTSAPPIASLFGSAVQSVVMVFIIGPSILLLGTAVPKSVIVVQAGIQFGYTTLVSMMLGADIFLIGVIAQAGYEMLLGSLTLIIAALLKEDINRLNKGLLTGRLMIYPVIEYMAAYLFENYAGCQLFGNPTAEFPFGMPMMCRDKYGMSYIASLYIYHGLKWAVIVFVTFVGAKFSNQILILSCALSGAALQTSSLSQMMLLLLRTWDAYWSSQGYDTGRLAQGTQMVTLYSNAVYYFLTMIGCLSMLTIRRYVTEVQTAEKVKKDIIANMEFRKITESAIAATTDGVTKKMLGEVKQRSRDLMETLVVRDELEMSEIYPLFPGSRNKLAKKLRKQLEPEWKAQNNRITSKMFEHKRRTTDGLPLEAARANKIIWEQKIVMPSDKDSLEKKYKCDDGPFLTNIDDYHMRLIENLEKKVDDPSVGQAFLFKNRILPIPWPQACKWPWKRDVENESDPNADYKLGEEGHKCWPPIRFVIGGPVIKNRLFTSRLGKWILGPMSALNIWVLEMQYSTQSMGQMMHGMINRSKTLSSFRSSAKIAQDLQGKANAVGGVMESVEGSGGGGGVADLAEKTVTGGDADVAPSPAPEPAKVNDPEAAKTEL